MDDILPDALYGALEPPDDEEDEVSGSEESDDESSPEGEGPMTSSAPKKPISRSLPPPLPLFNFSSPMSSSAPPKNGTGLSMIWPGPSYIPYVPREPETFYRAPESLMESVLARHADRLAHPHSVMNRIVFDYIDPNPLAKSQDLPPLPPGQLRPYYVPESDSDRTLVFESRFESGNLRRAIQVYEYEYDLILNPDFNTRGHTQWYYFSVNNTRKDARYRFNIINLVKGDSLYNYGMRPLVYSEKLAAEKGIGWHRDGEEMCYYQNHIKRRSTFYYTFTFSRTAQYDNDTVYFAYCYPLSYTDLQIYLKGLEDDPIIKTRFRRRTLCQSLAGNNVDLLTITSFACDPEALKARKGVVLTSRVHPGESNSSWMMKGIIDFLTGPTLEAKLLRDNFVFKVIPMMNPDGVIAGNYRCSLAGKDLNRQWKNPDRILQPSIWNTKMMIKRFIEDRDVLLFCDLHGHSRKKNIFIYGCDNKENPSLRLRERVLPRILWKNAQNFSFQDCSFKVQRSKESTARVVVWREMHMLNSFTMEASFAGANFGRNMNHHFSTAHLEEMGHFLCEALLDYCEPDQSRAQAVLKELEMLYPFKTYDATDDEQEDSAGSDDNPSEDNDPTLALRGALAVRRKARKKVKKRRKKGSVSATEGESKKRSSSTSATVKDKDRPGGKPPSKAAEERGRSRSVKRAPAARQQSGESEKTTKKKSKEKLRPAIIDASGALSAPEMRPKRPLEPLPSSTKPVQLPRFPFPLARSYATRFSEHVAGLSSPRTASGALLALTRDYGLDQRMQGRVPLQVAHVSLAGRSDILSTVTPPLTTVSSVSSQPPSQSFRASSDTESSRVYVSEPEISTSLPPLARFIPATLSDSERPFAPAQLQAPLRPRTGLPPTAPRSTSLSASQFNDAPSSLRTRSRDPPLPSKRAPLR